MSSSANKKAIADPLFDVRWRSIFSIMPKAEVIFWSCDLRDSVCVGGVDRSTALTYIAHAFLVLACYSHKGQRSEPCPRVAAAWNIYCFLGCSVWRESFSRHEDSGHRLIRSAFVGLLCLRYPLVSVQALLCSTIEKSNCICSIERHYIILDSQTYLLAPQLASDTSCPPVYCFHTSLQLRGQRT